MLRSRVLIVCPRTTAHKMRTRLHSTCYVSPSLRKHLVHISSRTGMLALQKVSLKLINGELSDRDVED